jgi:hypothetical protein
MQRVNPLMAVIFSPSVRIFFISSQNGENISKKHPDSTSLLGATNANRPNAIAAFWRTIGLVPGSNRFRLKRSALHMLSTKGSMK